MKFARFDNAPQTVGPSTSDRRRSSSVVQKKSRRHFARSGQHVTGTGEDEGEQVRCVFMLLGNAEQVGHQFRRLEVTADDVVEL